MSQFNSILTTLVVVVMGIIGTQEPPRVGDSLEDAPRSRTVEARDEAEVKRSGAAHAIEAGETAWLESEIPGIIRNILSRKDDSGVHVLPDARTNSIEIRASRRVLVQYNQLVGALERIARNGHKACHHRQEGKKARAEETSQKMAALDKVRFTKIPLKHAKAQETANHVDRFMNVLSNQHRSRRANRLLVRADRRTNSLLVAGTADDLLAVKELVAAIDAPVPVK